MIYCRYEYLICYRRIKNQLLLLLEYCQFKNFYGIYCATVTQKLFYKRTIGNKINVTVMYT